jgi:hypothetical protein
VVEITFFSSLNSIQFWIRKYQQTWWALEWYSPLLINGKCIFSIFTNNFFKIVQNISN